MHVERVRLQVCAGQVSNSIRGLPDANLDEEDTGGPV